MLVLLLAAQVVALIVIARRLARGRNRLPQVEPVPEGLEGTTVSIVVPTRNEVKRLGACLDGLRLQGSPLVEIIIVDGGSTDGTVELIDAAAVADPRIRRMQEPPLPPGGVGRPSALAAGFAAAKGEWVLGVDADAIPKAGMVAGVAAAAQEHRFDVLSVAPRIVAPSAGARWLQPSLLTTLVYRFGPAGEGVADPERAMANGQCLLMRRSTLEAAGGYAVAARSFCDDVAIVRHLARAGARVGFLDGPRLLDVLMYPDAAETWRAWPRSLNMRDTTRASWRLLDSVFLILAQALPIPVLVLLVTGGVSVPEMHWVVPALLATNGLLLLIRLLLLFATAHSFTPRGAPYWLSPLADLPVVLRVVETTIRRPREWRGSAAAPASAQPSRAPSPS
jgi:dolichol-phosphate mannosyltransferase